MYLACTFVCALCVFSVLRSQKAVVDSHGNGATDSCEPPRRCSDSNLGSTEEQPVLWTTEPSLQFAHAGLELIALFLAPPPECQHHRTDVVYHHASQQMFVTEYWKTATMVTSCQWELSISWSHGRLSQERQSKKMSDIKQAGLGWIGHLQMFRESIPNGQLSLFLISYEQTHNLQKGMWGFGEDASKKG